jgi:hypothetical protein
MQTIATNAAPAKSAQQISISQGKPFPFPETKAKVVSGESDLREPFT